MEASCQEQYYANNRTVIGYDLLNEPIPNYTGLEQFNVQLEPLYKRIAAAIRRVNTHHILILGGARVGQQLCCLGLPFDKNVVYTFHRYHAGRARAADCQPYVDFREKYQVPIWLFLASPAKTRTSGSQNSSPFWKRTT